VQAKVREGSAGERSGTTGDTICETGFKPGVKERRSWMSRVVKQKRKK